MYHVTYLVKTSNEIGAAEINYKQKDKYILYKDFSSALIHFIVQRVS